MYRFNSIVEVSYCHGVCSNSKFISLCSSLLSLYNNFHQKLSRDSITDFEKTFLRLDHRFDSSQTQLQVAIFYDLEIHDQSHRLLTFSSPTTISYPLESITSLESSALPIASIFPISQGLPAASLFDNTQGLPSASFFSHHGNQRSVLKSPILLQADVT